MAAINYESDNEESNSILFKNQNILKKKTQ